MHRSSMIAGLLLAGTAIGTPALAATIEVNPGDNLQAKIRSARPGSWWGPPRCSRAPGDRS